MNILSLLFGKQYNILAYLPEAVLVIDEAGKILYANKSAFKLFETNKLRNKNINDFFITNSDNIIANCNENIKQILKIVTEEQNTKITDVKAVDVSSKKNQRYILTIIDNTQDHSLLDELIKERQEHKVLNHTKNVLLTKMSNYLCSPLHSVIGFSQAMLEGLSGEINDKQAKYLQIMNGNSNELLMFLQKLIEISQAESNIYKPDYKTTDTISLLNVIINELTPATQGKDIAISTNTSELQKQMCYTDKNALSIIISNILKHAVNTIETGAININLSNPLPELLTMKGFNVNSDTDAKSYLMCEITLKGVDSSLYGGFEIFDPYVQVEKNSKKLFIQSLLLGTSKKYVEKLQGEIWIHGQFASRVSLAFIIPVEKEIIEKNREI